MRLFIGIALPAEVSDALQGIRQRFEPHAGSGLRWSARDDWHITIQFLGSVADDRLDCVRGGLRLIRAVRVPLRIADLGFFERAGVFWAGVLLTRELLALQQSVTAAMRPCGFIPEDRPYHPHITLARAQGRSGTRALAPLRNALEQSPPQLRVEFVAEEFLLYESLPGPEGSRYEVRATFPLSST
jgi:2'-5' RNA ligase